MLGKRFLLFVLLPVLTLAGCGRQQEDPVVASVGEREIRLEEFQRAFDEALRQEEGYRPDRESARRFLDAYIGQALREQVAADSVQWTPLLEHRARGFLESKMVRIMREDVYRHMLDIPEDELHRIYDRAATRYHYRYMYFLDPLEAAEVKRMVAQGAVFKAIASHKGFENGGDNGWKTVLDAPEAVLDALERLQPGEVTEPVKAGGVSYIAQMIEKGPNPDPLPPFESIKDKLKMQIMQQRAGNLLVEFQDELLRERKYELRPVEISWMRRFLYENTAHVSRQPPTEDGPLQDAAPWQSCPLPREDWDRVLATSTADTVTAILILDQLMSKLLMDWPTFEKDGDVVQLCREIMLDRAERAETWERGYDQRPDMAYENVKQRGLMLKRNFYQYFVWERVRPDVEEARAWYEAHAEEFREPERRRFHLLTVRDLDSALRARQTLAAVSDPRQAMDQIRAFDRTAAWVGSGEGELDVNAAATPLDRQLVALSPGQVTDPVPAQERFAIARLAETYPSRVPLFEVIAEKVVERLTEIRADSLLARYTAERRAATPVKIHEDALDRMTFTAEAGPARPAGSSPAATS